MTITSYEKIMGVFEGVCLAQTSGNTFKRIRNSLIRSKWYWLYKNEKWEDGFVRVILNADYRKIDFIAHCRNFGEGSVAILDQVRALVTDWED